MCLLVGDKEENISFFAFVDSVFFSVFASYFQEKTSNLHKNFFFTISAFVCFRDSRNISFSPVMISCK